ncbi:hypothetical protein IVB22_27965 [Bradyrhizobium sp. 190]|uniref:hypothetical protein n=1 Tax=Bradyrhizobium sp. 190 TaxID=2782658 RepID=UPI001FFC0171|nr:hypothetical protein [Bradyrhizobium sp. 190]MCK1516277.1 hypothetical protein [Bradyrhizobium sp. 190]
MKRSIAAIIAASVLASTAPASATNDLRYLHRSGYWKTFVTTTHNGTPLCGMQSDFGQNGIIEGTLMVKFIKGDQHVLVHVFKTSWRIPKDITIPVYMTFDNSQPFTATATGMVTQSGLSYVEFGIASDFLLNFFRLFAGANRMTLGFSEGSEQPWTTGMIGSREAVGSFTNCITTVSPPATSSTQPHGGGATQPYGRAPSTQPFGAKPAPTQPASRPVKRDDGSI